MAGTGISDRQACCAASHRGEPGAGPLVLAEPPDCQLALVGLGWAPGSALGMEVGTPGMPCERMQRE
jgi:hypothetical protein